MLSNHYVESTQPERYGLPALKCLVRAGVPVVLGSHDAGMWGDGEGTNMHEQVASAHVQRYRS